MRLVNDNSERGPQSPEPVNLLSVPLYALLCAVGFSSVILSPFVIILAHRRLPDYWPKVVSILGAIIALVVLEVPLTAVLLSFILGIFVADSVQRQVPLWQLLARSLLLAVALAFLGLVILNQWGERQGLAALWLSWVDKVIEQAQRGMVMTPDWDWDQARKILTYQGPFYFLSGCVLSIWLSIGLGAHLSWQKEEDLYSAKRLRSLRLSVKFIAGIFALWVANLLLGNQTHFVLAGVLHLGLMVLFIQGTIVLSIFLDRKQWKRGWRAFVYSVFIFLGFYALVGLGLFSPVLLNNKRRQESLPAQLSEETI